MLLAGSALPLVVRRRFPIVCLVVIYLSLVAYNSVDRAVSQPIGWGVLVAIYSIAWVGRRWHQVCVMVLIAVTSLASVKSPTTAAIGLLTCSAALLLGTLARRRDMRLRELAYRAGQLERDREAQAAHAVATERARIARDMHDVLAHAVSLMIVQAEAGAAVVRTSPERAEKALDAIAGAGRDAMVQLRRTLGMLKEDQDTGVRTPQPTLAAIPVLIDQVRETGVAASFTVSGARRAVPPDTEVAAYRIVQEALTNTLKHAAARTVTVALDWGDELIITICDDGSGDSALGIAGAGSGLIGIRERAAACGGWADARAGTHGFTVTASLPVTAR
ncbi:sensor histidine kinase [Dactylosporangium sp. NPDC048998]|uniref:sensor histidine kinase n=1 Tax=Dactylosporangium sp. NPDC048998 TaxID=3363976 RepID=UPI003722ADB5